MSTCLHLGPFADGTLTCTRPSHDDAGHVYESAWLADRHTQEVGDE